MNAFRIPLAKLAFLLVSVGSCYSFAQEGTNSTQKIRIVPSRQAQRIGRAIDWVANVEDAIKKASQTNKPVFWYVPTLNGSFMDRKAEIDRYMLAGPFSWTPTVNYINTNFVPVKAEPNREQQKRYGLERFDFIEPGFVILKPRSAELELKVDRITTLSPQWFNDVLFQVVQADKYDVDRLPAYWKQFQERKFQEVAQLTEETAEAQLFKGMALFRLGQHDDARTVWKEASQKFSDNPLAWKAAAEAEGIGPFYRGFESHVVLSGDYSAEPVEKGTTAIQESYSESQLWNRGIDFILGMQNKDGGYRDSDYDFGGTDSLPNVYVAVTSLAGMASLEYFANDSLSAEQKSQVADSIVRAAGYVANPANINRADRDEILWAYAYRLKFLVGVRASLAELKKYVPVKQDLNNDIVTAVKSLENLQSRRGSWYHEYSNPFVTSTALISLHHAREAGESVDQTKVARGIEALRRDRMKNGAYPYSSSRPGAESMAGTARDVAKSAGRMPLCELGLHYWSASNEEAIVAAIERSLELQENLNIALKYDDHTSNLAYGGFFFWYDMRARSEAIKQVSDPEIAARLKEAQRKIILGLPEIDGCFVDSHELGRVYGTAMALLSLAECR